MKVILSRKGFDSAYGGYPSPILPDGRAISIPIPSYSHVYYNDLHLDSKTTYYDIMCKLRLNIKYDGEWHELTQTSECHLDPDICEGVVNRSASWRACFGQIGGAQSHLENQGVKIGDLFLFFGWFKHIKQVMDRLRFEGSDIHLIFGYMQIGKIVHIKPEYQEPKWMSGHPHLLPIYREDSNNTIYIARERLSWNPELSGAGILKFNKSLVLTKSGLTRSKWQLPEFFKCAEISHHSKDSWKNGYFQSIHRGQEFVIQDYEKIENWAKNLIQNNV
jgi:hypothetical protein